MPCSSKIGLAFSRITACGVFEAPTTNFYSSSEPHAAKAKTDAPKIALAKIFFITLSPIFYIFYI